MQKIHFTEIFSDLFQKENLTANMLANRIGISHTQIQNYLSGSVPTTPTMVKICKYFDCSMDYITGLAENKKYENLKHIYNAKCFYPEYEKLLKANNTSHYSLSTKKIVCQSSLSEWKKGHLPQFEIIIEIAYELGGSIDKMLGRI